MANEKDVMSALLKVGTDTNKLAEELGIKDRQSREWKQSLRSKFGVDTNEDLYKKVSEYFMSNADISEDKDPVDDEAEYSLDELKQKLISTEIDRERWKSKYNMDRKLYQSILKQKSRTEEMKNIIEDIVTPLEFKEIPKIEYTDSTRSSLIEETAVLLLSDSHIGMLTDSYNSEKFILRLSLLVNRIKRISNNILFKAYKIPKLVIIFLGDIVDGESMRENHPFEICLGVMDQIFKVGVKYFTSAILELAKIFPEIDIHCVRGNHGRIGKRNQSPKETNWDTVFYETLKVMLSNYKNINFKISDKFYTNIKIYDHNILAVHGDQINMYRGIPWYGIETAASKWAMSMDEYWDIIAMGHFHTCGVHGYNTKNIALNGCFPSDHEWALEELRLKSDPRQLFFGVHPEEEISWEYRISLDERKHKEDVKLLEGYGG